MLKHGLPVRREMEVLMQRNGWYSIKQIAEITGLSTFVIRKWEERYNCIHPKRLQNGYRIYGERDLRLLQSIKQLVDRGYTVKNALLALSDGALEAPSPSAVAPPEPNAAADPEVTEDAGDETSRRIAEMLKAGEACDDRALRFLLQQTLHEHGAAHLINAIIHPFLYQVGERWMAGSWSEHQEHIASLTVRDFLLQLRGTFPERDNAPVLLGACLPFERHEIPLHLILLEAKLRGWKTVFLGPSPAPTALEQAVEQLRPRRVVLSASTATPFEQDAHALARLESLAKKHPRISFFLGGEGAWTSVRSEQLRYVKLTRDVKELLQLPSSVSDDE
ncbi:MerR family transcriptional regulator [Paenibacillus sp. TRM 82003]|nr:MerR family transcriptional regulator [Paenibacillus sp. TRM 82003]